MGSQTTDRVVAQHHGKIFNHFDSPYLQRREPGPRNRRTPLAVPALSIDVWEEVDAKIARADGLYRLRVCIK